MPPSVRPCVSRQAGAGIIVIASVALLAGCDLLAPGPTAAPDAWPIDPDAVTDPDRMVVEPDAAESGVLVQLTFPGGDLRGTVFAIDASDGEGWMRRAVLFSDANGGRPSWFHLDERPIGVEPIGIVGEGPDQVPIPEGLPPGGYRICTVNAVENLCVPIEIVEP
jgi:hypothetical protein